MRAVAFSVWIFINLAFLGMGGYIYLIISTYWCRDSKQTHVQPILHKKLKFNRQNQVVFYEKPEDTISKRKGNEAIVEESNPGTGERYQFFKKTLNRKHRTVRTCTENNNNNNNNNNCTESNYKIKLDKFKNKLFVQLRRVLHEESNVFKTDNPYSVRYDGPREIYQKLTSKEIKCRLQKANLRLLDKDDAAKSKFKFEEILGNEKFLGDKRYESCAIVSSAGSLQKSNLGSLIDQHEIVMRFNHAPTETYEEDVGSKTTIRLVNSQVVSKQEFHFTTSPLYKSAIIVVWDPSNYSSTLQQWYEKPDFNFFDLWAKQKFLHSKNNSFILDPRSIWKVWDFIQSLSSLRIRKNPPSSGFLGLTLLLPYCDTIDFFEYIPSFRLTKKCHYFDDIINDSCTFGVWHPLSAEKILSLAMNEANDSTVFDTGFIRIRGYRHLKC